MSRTFRTTLFTTVAAIALAAVSACGGSQSTRCQSPIFGSPTAESCGCFADVSTGASALEIEAALADAIPANPGACLAGSDLRRASADDSSDLRRASPSEPAADLSEMRPIHVRIPRWEPLRVRYAAERAPQQGTRMVRAFYAIDP